MTAAKSRSHYDFFKLYDKYVSACRRGKRVQKNRKPIKKDTLRNYAFLRKHLLDFCLREQFDLRIHSLKRVNKRVFKAEKKYWENFYEKFTNYLYDEEELYDNYVGMLVKQLRTFLNYLNDSLGMNVGSFHKSFYVPAEDIQIIVLSQDRLSFLIYNKEFEQKLPKRLRVVKDIFVFGCTVSLRISDLMGLMETNVERSNESVYITVSSKKTDTPTRMKLPNYAIEILNKYCGRQKYIFPRMHIVYLNKYIKELMELAGWTEFFEKKRKRRGVSVTVFKEPVKKINYRFCELITCHTMRRTAITTMLMLGMDEKSIRKISGHSPNSKEFFKYVSYSQTFLDRETDQVFEKLHKKHLEMVEKTA